MGRRAELGKARQRRDGLLERLIAQHEGADLRGQLCSRTTAQNFGYQEHELTDAAGNVLYTARRWKS